MLLTEFLHRQNQRLLAAAQTFRNLQAGHRAETEPWQAYALRIEQAEAAWVARQELLNTIQHALNQVQTYRQTPTPAGYQALRDYFDRLLVRQTVPLAETYLTRQNSIPGGPLPCGSCGRRLCNTLERHLLQQMPAESPKAGQGALLD